MNHPVEILTLEGGVRQTSRQLSQREAQRLGGYAASLAAGASGAGFFGYAVLTWSNGFVLQGPVFAAVVVAGMAGAGAWAWRRVVRKLSRYRVGPGMDDDAFAAESLDLVRRRRDGAFEVALVHGMTGVIEEGGLRRPVEGLTRRHELVWVPLLPATSVRIELGQTTFVVRMAPHEEARVNDSVPLPALAASRAGR